jgi:hypothetical protein
MGAPTLEQGQPAHSPARSIKSGAILGVQALNDPAERGHLVGDVPALILVAIILAVLMPRTAQA